MSPVRSRRDFLRLAGTSVAAGLAGCAALRGSSQSPTVTPAPVPTESPTATPRTTPEPPTPADFEFDVSVRRGFTAAGPARLEVGFRNVGDRLLTGAGGLQHVLPFVDDDYGGLSPGGTLELFLVPDETDLVVGPADRPPRPVEAYLPDRPTDGCWRLPFDWPAAWTTRPAVVHTVSVRPGRGVRHGYTLYHIDDCTAGTYGFEGHFDLTNTDPPLTGALYRTRLGFDLTVAPSGAVSAAVRPPTVGRTGSTG